MTFVCHPPTHPQALDLGAWLHHRYIHTLRFLPAVHHPDALSVRTTLIDRAYQTLRGVVTGLYPAAATSSLATPLLANVSAEDWEFEYGAGKTCGTLGPLQQQVLDKVAGVGEWVRNGVGGRCGEVWTYRGVASTETVGGKGFLGGGRA